MATTLPLPPKVEKSTAIPNAAHPHHPLATVSQIKLIFKTDLPVRKKPLFDAHPCGVLVAVRTAASSVPHTKDGGGTRDVDPREEQCFTWLDNVRAGHAAAAAHLARYGFPLGSDAQFLPYSSKAAWAHRYPHAFPHVHVDRLGRATGFPHWSPRARSALDIPPSVVHLAALPSTTAALAGYEARAAARRGGEGLPSPSPNTMNKRGGRLCRAAVLGNHERHQLHLDIYHYFSWLATEVAALEADEGGRRAVKKADLQLHGLRGLLTKLETTFKNVARKKIADDATRDAEALRPPPLLADPYGPYAAAEGAEDPAAPTVPLLEEALPYELAARAADEEAARREAKARQRAAAAAPPGGEALDFDVMFAKLLAHREEHGHPNVPVKYPRDLQLGSWVSGLRTKKKALEREGLAAADPEEGAWSLDPAGAHGEGEHGGGGDPPAPAPAAGPTPRYLSPERIQRLEALGFAWSMARPKAKPKSWDERLHDLQRWRAERGTFKVPRHESLGEWLHNQRTLYARRDPKFMTKKAPRLEEIGYVFGAREGAAVSWDARFRQLVEFRQEFGSFEVPWPGEDGEEQDGDEGGVKTEEALEKLRFYRWVARLHNEYRAFEKGTSSKLNAERVEKLRAINFEFKGPKNRGRPSVSNLALVPKIPWEERVKQLESFRVDTGHLRIDHNYRHCSNLGGWAAEISTLYKAWKEGTAHLAEDMIAKFHQLLALGFQFDILPYYESNRSWEDHYAVLLRFGEEHGGIVRVPLKYKADLRLGKWVQVQRQQYRLRQSGEKSKLTDDRVGRLESVGFEWEVAGYNKQEEEEEEEEVQEGGVAGDTTQDETEQV